MKRLIVIFFVMAILPFSVTGAQFYPEIPSPPLPPVEGVDLIVVTYPWQYEWGNSVCYLPPYEYPYDFSHAMPCNPPPECVLVATSVTEINPPVGIYHNSFYDCDGWNPPPPPEVPLLVQSWLQDANIGDTWLDSYQPTITWVVETTTVAAYDFKPGGALNVRRFNLTNPDYKWLEKISSEDFPAG